MSLNELLEKMRETSWGKFSPQQLAVVIRARDELACSGALERAMRVGDTAPDFTLPSVSGPKITLSHLLRSGPVVAAFYRGRW